MDNSIMTLILWGFGLLGLIVVVGLSFLGLVGIVYFITNRETAGQVLNNLINNPMGGIGNIGRVVIEAANGTRVLLANALGPVVAGPAVPAPVPAPALPAPAVPAVFAAPMVPVITQAGAGQPVVITPQGALPAVAGGWLLDWTLNGAAFAGAPQFVAGGGTITLNVPADIAVGQAIIARAAVVGVTQSAWSPNTAPFAVA